MHAANRRGTRTQGAKDPGAAYDSVDRCLDSGSWTGSIIVVRMRKLLPVLLATATLAMAHTVSGRDADFVRNSTGTHIAPFLYLGAKHMVTGYDHLLFLVGVTCSCTG